jgi:2-hydroxychromene-2-carboxylate isomerase
VTRLTIYGDFNCPYSALASVRADVLLGSGEYEIDWRAVQHDVTIPDAGEPVEGEVATHLESEVAEILELSERDVHLHLAVPPVRPNTAAASAALAASGEEVDRLRRRLFSAVWVEGRNVGDPSELDHLGADARDDTLARRWQEEFDRLPQPVTPTLVLPDGYVSRGLGALSRLADLGERTRQAAGERLAGAP